MLLESLKGYSCPINLVAISKGHEYPFNDSNCGCSASYIILDEHPHFIVTESVDNGPGQKAQWVTQLTYS